MCLRDTDVRFRSVNARRFGRIIALATGIVVCAGAQTSAPWTRVAGTTINCRAGWTCIGTYRGDLVRRRHGQTARETESSRVFETADFVHWRLNTDATAPARKWRRC